MAKEESEEQTSLIQVWETRCYYVGLLDGGCLLGVAGTVQDSGRLEYAAIGVLNMNAYGFDDSSCDEGGGLDDRGVEVDGSLERGMKK